MEATTKHNWSHGFWVLAGFSQLHLWASEFQENKMTEPKETPKSKHSKAFLQHPDDPGILFPFSAPWLCPYVIFRTPTSELSNSWPTCAGQGAVLLEKLGHVTPKVKSALWHGTGKLGTDSLWSRQFLCLVQMEVRRDLVQSHVLEWAMVKSCAEAIFCPGMISIGLYWFKSWLPCLEFLTYCPQQKASGHGA